MWRAYVFSTWQVYYCKNASVGFFKDSIPSILVFIHLFGAALADLDWKCNSSTFTYEKSFSINNWWWPKNETFASAYIFCIYIFLSIKNIRFLYFLVRIGSFVSHYTWAWIEGNRGCTLHSHVGEGVFAVCTPTDNKTPRRLGKKSLFFLGILSTPSPLPA